MNDFPEEREDYNGEGIGKGPDTFFLRAQQDIRDLYEGDLNGVFYLRQLQVRFEKKYYHWVTNNALEGLIKINYLRDIKDVKETGTSTRFFIHRANRYPRRAINNIEKIIAAYSQDHINSSCGHRAEDLFCKALAMRALCRKRKKLESTRGLSGQKPGTI